MQWSSKILVAAAVVTAACGSSAGDPSCHRDNDCDAPEVCDLKSKRCVACTATQVEACSGSTPTCGDDHTCQACVANDECAPTSLCMPDGSCSAAAYVNSLGTDNPLCSRETPCAHIAAGLATGQPYVHLEGAFDEPVTIADGSVTLVAEPGTTLTNHLGGAIVTVSDRGQLAIIGLTIGNARSTNTMGVYVPAGSGAPSVSLTQVTITKCSAEAISVASGSLTVAQSIVSLNPLGGIAVSGKATFVIVGNQFWGNGTNNSPVGGVAITTAESPGNRLEFNSFDKNASQDYIGAAIQCTAGRFTARNNVMAANGTPTNQEQVGGSCSHEFSIIASGTLPLGRGNQAKDPLFRNPAAGDLHLQTGSPAIMAADPRSDLSGLAAYDRDGHVRMSPADVGALQYP